MIVLINVRVNVDVDSKKAFKFHIRKKSNLIKKKQLYFLFFLKQAA